MQRVRQLIEDGKGLPRCDDDCLVKGLRPRLDMLHRILVDALVQDTDLIDPVHYAADLRDRRPGQSVDDMKRLQPTLNFQRTDIASEFIAPTGNEVIPDVMLHDP